MLRAISYINDSKTSEIFKLKKGLGQVVGSPVPVNTTVAPLALIFDDGEIDFIVASMFKR